jgi:hypothetical protein
MGRRPDVQLRDDVVHLLVDRLLEAAATGGEHGQSTVHRERSVSHEGGARSATEPSSPPGNFSTGEG